MTSRIFKFKHMLRSIRHRSNAFQLQDSATGSRILTSNVPSQSLESNEDIASEEISSSHFAPSTTLGKKSSGFQMLPLELQQMIWTYWFDSMEKTYFCDWSKAVDKLRQLHLTHHDIITATFDKSFVFEPWTIEDWNTMLTECKTTQEMVAGLEDISLWPQSPEEAEDAIELSFEIAKIQGKQPKKPLRKLRWMSFSLENSLRTECNAEKIAASLVLFDGLHLEFKSHGRWAPGLIRLQSHLSEATKAAKTSLTQTILCDTNHEPVLMPSTVTILHIIPKLVEHPHYFPRKLIQTHPSVQNWLIVEDTLRPVGVQPSMYKEAKAKCHARFLDIIQDVNAHTAAVEGQTIQFQIHTGEIVGSGPF